MYKYKYSLVGFGLSPSRNKKCVAFQLSLSMRPQRATSELISQPPERSWDRGSESETACQPTIYWKHHDSWSGSFVWWFNVFNASSSLVIRSCEPLFIWRCLNETMKNPQRVSPPPRWIMGRGAKTLTSKRRKWADGCRSLPHYE